MFPALPQQSRWGKRVRRSTGLLSAVITELARDTPSWGEIARLIDSTPVPCGKSRETVKRSDPAGHTGYGSCTSHSRYFWGFRLYLICTPEGMPVVRGLANPKIGEREAAEAMLSHDRHLTHPGQVLVGDNPERIRSEAALVKLAGISPVPASSGMTSGRHRINHDGHRQLNAAIYRAVIVRMRFHQPTLDYRTPTEVEHEYYAKPGYSRKRPIPKKTPRNETQGD